MPQHSWDTDVYYKIIVPHTVTRKNEFFIIATLQDFDETDYFEDEWLRDDEHIVSFNTKKEAEEYLNASVDPKWIDPVNRIPPTNVSHYRHTNNTKGEK